MLKILVKLPPKFPAKEIKNNRQIINPNPDEKNMRFLQNSSFCFSNIFLKWKKNNAVPTVPTTLR